jgi:hypothetical protein
VLQADGTSRVAAAGQVPHGHSTRPEGMADRVSASRERLIRPVRAPGEQGRGGWLAVVLEVVSVSQSVLLFPVPAGDVHTNYDLSSKTGGPMLPVGCRLLEGHELW